MKTARKYWIIAAITGCLLIVSGLLELVVRRETPPTPYLLNKAIACAGLLMIVLSYVFSAAHHFWKSLRIGLALRRSFGITGFILVVVHVGLVFTIADPIAPQNAKFPFPDYFWDNWIAILPAMFALLYFCYACSISINPARFCTSAAATAIWRRRLRYGYVAALAALLHAGLLKYEGWMTWFETYQPALPPLSLIVISCCLVLLALKGIQLIQIRRLF